MFFSKSSLIWLPSFYSCHYCLGRGLFIAIVCSGSLHVGFRFSVLWHHPSGLVTVLPEVLSAACVFSRVRLLATPWTVAHQAPLSMGFPRQEYWSGLPLPPSGNLPGPGIEPATLVSWIGRQVLFHCVTWESRGLSEASCLLSADLVPGWRKPLLVLAPACLHIHRSDHFLPWISCFSITQIFVLPHVSHTVCCLGKFGFYRPQSYCETQGMCHFHIWSSLSMEGRE